VAAGTTIIFLCRDGAWVLIALIPYVLAYFSYRGSVIAAGHYGSALETLINLNRFALYEQLHVQLPASTEKEREANEKLMGLLAYKNPAGIAYKHPDAADVANPQSAVQTAPGPLRPEQFQDRRAVLGQLGLTNAADPCQLRQG
jgi:hypothetical protein